MDGTNLYVVGNNTVGMMVISSLLATTLAGSSGSSGSTDATTGSDARFTGLEGITNDGTSLFLTDVNNHTIRKID
ncbi:uncharacterized protein METZ01_LOCUS311830 [marine metagenome]|uniref:Uncharacterized protein n=1 Tax=marine metagenome TaxID=408172 RepID=A0A382ND45_9ZZZZ